MRPYTTRLKRMKRRLPRVPWQEQHLLEIFSSPIFHGNQGAKKRLLVGGAIFQDAAYWVPILLYWTLGTREEICGLEFADIFLDEPIPYIFIRENSDRAAMNRAASLGVAVREYPLATGPCDYLLFVNGKAAPGRVRLRRVGADLPAHHFIRAARRSYGAVKGRTRCVGGLADGCLPDGCAGHRAAGALTAPDMMRL